MNPNAATHCQMPSGRFLPLIGPKPEHIHWADFAEKLAKLNRFGGSTPNITYSVAQHSCHVADALPPELRLYGLLHDAHEAPLGDWITPVKNALAIHGGRIAMASLERLEGDMAAAIHRAADLSWPLCEADAARVKRADMAALATERRDLMPPATAAAAIFWQGLPDPWPRRIRPWPWLRAADEFMQRLNTLQCMHSAEDNQ